MNNCRSTVELVAYAVNTNHTKDIRDLISNGFQIDSLDNVFQPNTAPMTVMCFAASRNEIDIVLTLIMLGANVNSPTANGDTPIHLAIQSMKPSRGQTKTTDITEALVRILIYYGADVCATNDVYEAPLHTAARVGDAAMVKILLDNGAEILAVCTKGLSAVDVCQAEIAKLTPSDTTVNPFGLLWTGVVYNVQLNRYRETCDLLDAARLRELKFREACTTELMYMRRVHNTETDNIEDLRAIFQKLRPQFVSLKSLKINPREIFDTLIRKGYLNPDPDIPRVFPPRLSTPL
jgi:hypothetical protein